MPLRFGLALMNDFPAGADIGQRIGQLREQAREAARSGIDSIWVLQHYLGAMPTLQPVQILSALAADSGSMKLGTNMYILPLRHPVGVAEEFATLDQISGGRAVAGFGMGYRENEFEAFGIPMDERIGRYTESVEIIRKLWTNEPVSYSGKHFKLDHQKISLPPAQNGGPKIFVGAGAHRVGILRAAQLGDAWIVPPHVAGERLSQAMATYTGARQEAHPNAASQFMIRRELVLDDDREKAFAVGAAARSALTSQYGKYNAPDKTADYSQLADAQAADEKAREAYVFTDPAGAVEEFRRLEASGITDIVLRMQWFDLPHERMLHTLELFREQVLPHFSSGHAA